MRLHTSQLHPHTIIPVLNELLANLKSDNQMTLIVCCYSVFKELKVEIGNLGLEETVAFRSARGKAQNFSILLFVTS